MFWRFCRTKPFIDSYSTSRDRQSNASPLFFGSPLNYSRGGEPQHLQGQGLALQQLLSRIKNIVRAGISDLMACPIPE